MFTAHIVIMIAGLMAAPQSFKHHDEFPTIEACQAQLKQDMPKFEMAARAFAEQKGDADAEVDVRGHCEPADRES